MLLIFKVLKDHLENSRSCLSYEGKKCLHGGQSDNIDGHVFGMEHQMENLFTLSQGKINKWSFDIISSSFKYSTLVQVIYLSL